MKKYFFAACLCALSFISLASRPAFSADVRTIIREDEYYETLYKLFSEAELSIDIIIDAIVTDPLNPKNPVNRLIEKLVEARQRGVGVRVILEDLRSPKNIMSYRKLLEGGIDVYFDTSKLLINSKAIVVDSKICVIGNAVWSPESWGKHYALSAILESEGMAKAVTDSISKVRLTERSPFMEKKPSGLLLSDDFLLPQGLGTRFVKEKADKALDLYLAFIKEAQEKNTDEFDLDYTKFARRLSLKEEFRRGLGSPEEEEAEYKKRVKRILKTLTDRYRLAEYDESTNTVKLLKQFGADVSAPNKNGPYFILPNEYWDAGLPYALTLNEKYVYLIALREAAKSARYPFWFSNEYLLSESYGLPPAVISSGLESLEEKNLIEAARVSGVNPESKKERLNVYRVNKIITREEFDSKIEALASDYGEETVEKAREQASKLNESNDLFVIEIFARLIQKYGYPAVRRANINTLDYEKGSSLRHISTTVKMLERE